MELSHAGPMAQDNPRLHGKPEAFPGVGSSDLDAVSLILSIKWSPAKIPRFAAMVGDSTAHPIRSPMTRMGTDQNFSEIRSRNVPMNHLLSITSSRVCAR